MDNRDERVGESHATLASWSLLFADRCEATRAAAQTLTELCLRHASAIYAYLRRRGHDPDEAVRWLHAFVHGQSAPTTPTASFRLWLPAAIEAFLARPAPAAEQPVPACPPGPELEHRFAEAEAEAAALAPRLDAATAFAGDFARGMLAHARDRLQLEATQAGRVGLYAQLVPYLAVEPTPEQVALLANAHALPAPALATALKRLRQRFRELVDAELAATVADPAALEGERMALYAALAGAAR
ncbi:MAG: hypothetical protein ACREO3_06015 [Arenimonas sp.]